MNEDKRSLGTPTGWLSAQLWRPLIPFIMLFLLVVPAWLFWDNLLSPRLKGDDFAFLAECRSGETPIANLFKPHNTHIVPAFRLLTAGLCLIAKTPGDFASNTSLANYGALAFLLLLLGHVVAWETKRLSAGLFAMAFVGLSSVIRPSVVWYSAGQTLWAATGCLATLVLLQFYRIRKNKIWLGLALVSVLLATSFWGGGLTAGLAGAAYCVFWVGKTGRLPALLQATLACLLLLTLVIVTRGASSDSQAQGDGSAPGVDLVKAITHTSQAIPEKLISPSFGVDITTTPTQGLLFCAGLAAWWFRSVRARGSIRPLEGAGLSLIVVPYLLGFALRSQYTYENLRNLGWYDTLPLVGLTLFLVGWLAPVEQVLPGVPARPSWRSTLGLLVFVVIMILLQTPRVEKQFIAEAPALSEAEARTFPIAELQRLRAKYLLSNLGERQRLSLIRLKLASTEAQKTGISREAIRRVRGPVYVPGWPIALTRIDALDLFNFPPDRVPGSNPVLNGSLRQYLEPVPIPRPTWLTPADPWPPGGGTELDK